MKTTMIKEVYGEGVLALADLRRWRSALAVCVTLPVMHWTNEFELHWRWWDGRGAWGHGDIFLASSLGLDSVGYAIVPWPAPGAVSILTLHARLETFAPFTVSLRATTIEYHEGGELPEPTPTGWS